MKSEVLVVVGRFPFSDAFLGDGLGDGLGSTMEGLGVLAYEVKKVLRRNQVKKCLGIGTYR